MFCNADIPGKLELAKKYGIDIYNINDFFDSIFPDPKCKGPAPLSPPGDISDAKLKMIYFI